MHLPTVTVKGFPSLTCGPHNSPPKFPIEALCLVPFPRSNQGQLLAAATCCPRRRPPHLRRPVPAATTCRRRATEEAGAHRHLLPSRCPLLPALLISVARSTARSPAPALPHAPCCPSPPPVVTSDRCPAPPLPRATSRIRGQVTQIYGVGRVFGGQALFLPVSHAPPSGACAHPPCRQQPGPHPPHQLVRAFPASKCAPYPLPSSPSATRSSSPSARRAASPSSYPIHRWGSHSKCHRVPAIGQCHQSVDTIGACRPPNVTCKHLFQRRLWVAELRAGVPHPLPQMPSSRATCEA
jgi:hypothetical protein